MTMADQVRSTGPRSTGHHVPAVARHRQLPGARRAAARVAEVPRQRRRAEDAVHVGRVARARGRAICGRGSGSSPAARNRSPNVGSYVALRDRRPVVHRRPRRPGPRSRPTTTPACTAGAPLKDHGGRCSEFRCPFHGFTWALDGDLRFDPGATGTSNTSTTTTSRSPRPRSTRGAGSSSSTRTPRPGRSPTSSARSCPSSSTAGSSRIATSRPTSRRSSAATGRSPRRRSASRTTHRPRTRRPRAISATSTARSTSGTTSPG